MRSRIFAIAAGVVTVVVIVFAVLALSGGSENSLARAAENLKGQNMRIKFAAGVAQGNEDTALSGGGVVSADGKSARLEMSAEVQGRKITITQLRAAGQVYIASNQFAGHL